MKFDKEKVRNYKDLDSELHLLGQVSKGIEVELIVDDEGYYYNVDISPEDTEEDIQDKIFIAVTGAIDRYNETGKEPIDIDNVEVCDTDEPRTIYLETNVAGEQAEMSASLDIYIAE